LAESCKRRSADCVWKTRRKRKNKKKSHKGR
jgi:hypothetical protein